MKTFENISNHQTITFGKAENSYFWRFQNTDYQYLHFYSFSSSFTGKEKDPETGYSYFGSRYLDHELMTGWLSVDPMVDKYPSISPYAYCAWNPVKLVDPNGDTVVLSLTAQEMHNRFYNVNDEYTSLFNELHSRSDILFLVNEYGVTPHLDSDNESGIVIEYYPNEGDPYGSFIGDVYLIEWKKEQPELGGDKSHVFLEEMYHAKQILEYGNNNGTIEREVKAKEFAIRVSPSIIKDKCTDKNGYSDVPTQLGIIQKGCFYDSCQFLKNGKDVFVINPWGDIIKVPIPGAYSSYPMK